MKIFTFGEFFHKENSIPDFFYKKDSQSHQDHNITVTASQEGFGYYKISNSLIIKGNKSNSETVQATIFTEANLENGIQHKNLGKMKIRSALFIELNKPYYTSIYKKSDKNKSLKLNLIFFEIDDAKTEQTTHNE